MLENIYFCPSLIENMKKVLTLLFLYLSQIAYSQQALAIETFRKLTTTDQRCDFLVDSNMTKFDKPTYEAFLPIIEAKKDNKAAFFWHFQYMRFAQQFKVFNTEMLPKILEKMTKIAEKSGLEAELVIAQYQNALLEFGKKRINEQQVYALYLSYFEQIKHLGVEKFSRYTIDQTLHEIGRNFYELGDKEKALDCLLLAEKCIPQGSMTHVQTLILNLIESIYADSKDYPQAIVYAQKIYKVNSPQNPTQNAEGGDWLHTFWQGMASLDIAQFMFEMGKVKECETYANRGYELYKGKEDFTNHDKTVAEFDALQVLIKIKLQLGKLSEVEPLFQRVERLKPHIRSDMESFYFKPLRLYNNYYRYYEAQKDYINAFRYMKLANEMQDSLNRRNDKRKLWQVESHVKADSYQAQIKLVEEDNKLQQRLRNFAVLALVLFGVFAFIVYRRIKNDNKIITEQKALLEQSLGEKENLLKEIHHRVKNNLQIISGLFEKQALKASDEVSKKLMKEGQDRVFSIALVHQNLYQTDNLSTIEIKTYLEMLVKNIEKSQNTQNQKIDLALNVDDSTVDIDTAIPLGLILNELITNAYKYAFKDKLQGLIRIEFHQKAKDFFLQVQDNGIGIPSNFDINKTKSLGLNLVRGLVRQLNGVMDFKSNTEGTVFTIHFKR
jgi:two-component sensor histidine kinase/tetratricopeptide (TPR) repeat protein